MLNKFLSAGEPRLPRVLFIACFLGTLSATYLAYHPGLAGPFLFDDHINLPKMALHGEVDSLRSAARYFTASQAGPLGRPISVASFLLDDHSWPSDPYLFKYHNVLFHLLAGVLLFWLLLEVLSALEHRHAHWLALLGATIWLLHPLWVSTVLFVVQRMAILSALFVLAGLALYVRGRRMLPQRGGYRLMSAGIGIFTPLAALSKENGILLPMLAMVIEHTVFRNQPRQKAHPHLNRAWSLAFLYGPALAPLLYIAFTWDQIIAGYERRTFTLPQRLLTEARILFDYLGHLTLPSIQTNGLFNDNYPVSAGLLNPPSTLLAVTGICTMILLAMKLRSKRPILTLAILFFLVGHLLESTVIPLELYFEHRNYLPAALLPMPLALIISRLTKRTLLLSSFMLVATLGIMTYLRSSLWADEVQLSLVWAEENPTSIRAQQQAAAVLSARGLPQRAIEHINRAIEYNPDRAILRVQKLVIQCDLGKAAEADVEAAKHSLSTGSINFYTINNLDVLVGKVIRDKCTSLSLDEARNLLKALLGHPNLSGTPTLLQRALYLDALLAFAAEDREYAIRRIEQAFDVYPNPGAGMWLVAVLASHNEKTSALRLLERVEARHRALKGHRLGLRARLFRYAQDLDHEIPRIRGILQDELSGIHGHADR